MKRNRRVGKETASANLFITQFKLKASQSTNKDYKHRKMNTTLGNFKQILLQDNARKERQSANGRQKPLLQQLKFKNKEDDFRPPQSITKRSISKAKEESRLNFGNQTNNFFDPIQQQPFGKKEAIDKSRAIAQYFAPKPQKPLTQKSVLKQKLEKTALEKFNSVVLKENQQNQNVVSQKCAEVLYTLLKTARMNKYRQTALKSQPGQQNNDFYEQLILKNNEAQMRKHHLNNQNTQVNGKNSYFAKEANKKNEQLFLQSNTKPSTHQNQQQSSFGLSKQPNQNSTNQVEGPRNSIYEKFHNDEEDDCSQQSSFDDLDLKAQSSIAQKRDYVSSKAITKELKQQKKTNNLPIHQPPSKPIINKQKQQFKGAVGFNFIPKATSTNQIKNEGKNNGKNEQKHQRPSKGESNCLNNKVEKDMYNIKNKEKIQSIVDNFNINDKKPQTKIVIQNSKKDLKNPTKVQSNIPQRKDEKDLYDIKSKAKIESIVDEQMISLKNKNKIESIADEQMISLKNKNKIESIVDQENMVSLKDKNKISSIVDNFKLDKIQAKNDIKAKDNSIKSNKSKENDKKSNLLSIPSEIESIPEADVIQRKNDGSSKNFISLNNNMIEKVLTQDNMKKASENPKKQTQSNKISLPPPRLSKNTQVKNPNSSKAPFKDEIDDDGIQEVNIGVKKQLFPPSPNNQKTQPKVIPSKAPPIQQKKQSYPQKEKIVQKIQAPLSQHSQQEDQPDELQDELCFYIERIEDVGLYRIISKDCYNDKSIDKQLIQIHRICAYYLAHQFLYLAHSACSLFKSSPFTRQFYTITTEELNILKQREIIDEQVATLEEHLQESKKLLKKSYDQCKTFLEKKEQILLMDAKVSYHLKCCSYVIKQFQKVYEFRKKNPNLITLTKRCAYLINLYCTLRLLNGQQLKQHETLEQIENLSEYVESNKHFIESQ